MNIPLGYEVGTGKAVEIPLRHLAVTGQTQESGKTTTLEALIYRSKLRAVAFLTKRGESSFHRARRILPYFRERADWQFVRSILEATMRQGMKFQTSWIVKLCEARSGGKEKWPAPKSLADVRRNVSLALETARGLNESVYTELGAYLDIVLPQIDSLPRANKVELESGINVMDLTAYSMEMQGLVIRSVLEWVHERESNVITIIPEAWEFIPQDRGSPVLLAAQLLCRQGAGIKNFVWIDSQDIAGVHKTILRGVGVWIFGVQREIREVKRTLEHIPLGSPMPKARDIMTLHKGEFFVCYQERMVKTYVMPYWLPDVEARAIALGESSVEKVGQFKPTGRKWEEEGDEVWKERCELAEAESEKKENRIRELEIELVRLRREAHVTPTEKPIAPANLAENPKAAERSGRKAPPTFAPALPTPDLNGFYADFKRRLLSDPQVLDVLAERPEIEVRLIRPKLEVDGKSARGICAQLIAEGWFNEAKNAYVGYLELTERRCKSIAKATYYTELEALAEMGFLVRSTDASRKVFYQAVAEMKVRIVNGG